MGYVQFIRGTPRKSKFGRVTDALAQGIQGFQQGRQSNVEGQKETLAMMKTLADINKLQQETQGLNAPVPAPDYFRDPASGKLYAKDPYRGRGTTVNLPFQFDAGQKDETSGEESGEGETVYSSPDEADNSGLPSGSVVMVINPETGEPEEYEV